MKIDVSKIEGFAEMTAEDKLTALMGYEFEEPKAPDASEEVTKLKAALSKANSEAASWKNQFRAKQTEQERAEAERAENEKAIQEELAALRRGKVVDEYAKRCMGMGYDADLAAECAEAMADGRFNDVFAAQQKFMEAKTREIEAAALNKQPGISAGAPPVNASDKSEENKMRGYFGLPPLK
jgi:hypothetical protein